MATDKKAEEVRKANRRSDADAPFQDASTDPDNRRGDSEGRVGEPVTSSFDERTGVTQPFVRVDGSQDNGAADLEEPEGARRETTREGERTTVEETNTAIEEGTISGTQKIGSEEEQAAPKNPVATSSDTGAPANVTTQPTGKNTKPAEDASPEPRK